MNLNFDEMMYLAENKQELTAKREVVDGVGVVIFSYHVAFTDTFDCPLSREFRGTTFREDTKECICRPFPKFFNVGERPDTQHGKINWDNAKFYAKHDGSMATPVLINGKIFWKTKKSFFSDVALKAQSFFDRGGYTSWDADYLTNLILPKFTPIFEYVGPNNQIVLPYEKEQFIYLGSRVNSTGEYRPNDDLRERWVTYDAIHTMENIEGFVVDDGNQLVKIKTDWYCRNHRIVSEFNPKTIIKASLNNTIDDTLSLVSQLGMTLRHYQICDLRDKTLSNYFNIKSEIECLYKSLVKFDDRKEFALQVQKNIPQLYRGIMFQLRDGKNIDDLLNKIVFDSVYNTIDV